MQVLLIIPAILVIPGLIIWLAWRQQQQARANLQALADRHGLQVIRKSGVPGALGEAQGMLAGRPVRFWTYSTGGGKSRTTWCGVAVRPAATGGLEFELQRQNFGTKIMAWFGAKEIQVGDAAFDPAWFIRTNQPDFFAAALVPEIREKFMALPQEAGEGGYKLAEGEVRYAVQGFFSSPKVGERLEARLSLLGDLAAVAEVCAAEAGAH